MLKLLDKEIDGNDITELYRYEDTEYLELYLKHKHDDGGYMVRALSLNKRSCRVELYLIMNTREEKGKWLVGEREITPELFGIWLERVRKIDNIDAFCKFVEMYFP